MRNFIIVGHRAVTDSKFSLNDLPGGGGRMDIIARCISAAFLLSHGMRKDIEAAVVLLGPGDPPKTVRFIGSELKYLNPDERSTSALIRNAIVKHSMAKPEPDSEPTESSDALPNEINSSPGIYISGNGLPALLDHYSAKSTLVYLKESATDISKTKIATVDGNLTFVLSDDKDFTADEEKLINDYSKAEVSIGPEIIHTDHCIILVHNFLDRAK